MNIDIKTLFPRGSRAFLQLNSSGTMTRHDYKNDSTVNVDVPIAKYETNHQRKIQDTEQREQTPALGSEGGGKASRPSRPLIGFTLYRVKLLDWEAKYSSVKDLLDGCIHAGLLDGDREDQIDPKSYVRQVKVGTYAEEKTLIEIET